MEVSWNKGISRRHEIGSWIVSICCEIESKLNWKFIKLCSIQTCSINAKKSGIFWFFLGFEISGIIRNMLCQNMYCIEIGLFYGIWNKYDAADLVFFFKHGLAKILSRLYTLYSKYFWYSFYVFIHVFVGRK